MLRTALAVAIATLSMVVLSCLIAAMAVFIGGGRTGTDLHALLSAQLWLIPIALTLATVGGWQFIAPRGFKSGVRDLWRHVPQWLVFVFVLLNSLLLIAELGFFLINRITQQSGSLLAHVPLVCMLCSTLGILTLYARRHAMESVDDAMSGRWP